MTTQPETAGKPKIVCLCGSSRHPDLHMRQMMAETLAGNIVVPMGLYGHADFPAGAKAATNDGDESTAAKQMLDRLHFAKIALADEVVIITVDNYIGSSTAREKAFAEQSGKVVRVVNHPAAQATAGKPTAGAARYGVRPDGSIWLSVGDPSGSHRQGDIEVSESDAQTIVEALNVRSETGMTPRQLAETHEIACQTIARMQSDREQRRDYEALANLASWLGVGLGDGSVTAEQYEERIRAGTELHTQVAVAALTKVLILAGRDKFADEHNWMEFWKQRKAAISIPPSTALAEYGLKIAERAWKAAWEASHSQIYFQQKGDWEAKRDNEWLASDIRKELESGKETA